MFLLLLTQSIWFFFFAIRTFEFLFYLTHNLHVVPFNYCYFKNNYWSIHAHIHRNFARLLTITMRKWIDCKTVTIIVTMVNSHDAKRSIIQLCCGCMVNIRTILKIQNCACRVLITLDVYFVHASAKNQHD